ncbi:MAG: protein of unknown function with transrane region [Parcubacteria group bacterium]|nr:protein of unknown function with transrane region [Parcubacteria group bacterium]
MDTTSKTLIIGAVGVLILMGIVGAAREYDNFRGGQWNNVGNGYGDMYGGIDGDGITSGVACTMEAKLCPDGSYVGRTGPDCAFSACPDATSTTGTTGSTSGGSLVTGELTGTVTLGPTCPVMRNPPDPGCEDKAYQTTVVVSVASSGKEVGRQETDASGRFKFAFLPGTYTVTALGGSVYPRCEVATAVLVRAATTTTAISCDTGIR